MQVQILDRMGWTNLERRQWAVKQLGLYWLVVNEPPPALAFQP